MKLAISPASVINPPASMVVRILCAILCLTAISPASENPYIDKFGGPYPKLSQDFNKATVEYGGFWGGVFSTFGAGISDDKKGFAEFLENDVNPLLEKIKPSTPEEEKVKAAAIHLKNLFEAQVTPEKFSEEQLAEMDRFMSAAIPAGEEKSQINKLAWAILQFRLFHLGKTLDDIKKMQGLSK